MGTGTHEACQWDRDAAGLNAFYVDFVDADRGGKLCARHPSGAARR
jgi:hypothetical protein